VHNQQRRKNERTGEGRGGGNQMLNTKKEKNSRPAYLGPVCIAYYANGDADEYESKNDGWNNVN
jgi:hypothetical protein